MNAEEEPEHIDYPKDPVFRKMSGPRGVIHSYRDGKIEDTGALTRKRMETIDDEIISTAMKFIDKAHAADQPFFVWVNTTGMHFRTHTKPDSLGRSGQGFYNDSMMDHDDRIGSLLDQLDTLKIVDNTIVYYTTDNGPHYNFWPDAAISPFRSEKNTNWEGGYRVPALVRWPGKIKAGAISNEITSHTDWYPTLMAVAGVPDIKQKLLKGHRAGRKSYNVHLDGYNLLPYLTGNVDKSPRDSFIYINDDGFPVGVRKGPWKTVFAEQRAKRMDVWSEPFVFLRIPKLFNLRRDPFERAADESNAYNEWWIDRAPRVLEGGALVKQFMATFVQYPPRMVPATFTIDQAVQAFRRQMLQVQSAKVDAER